MDADKNMNRSFSHRKANVKRAGVLIALACVSLSLQAQSLNGALRSVLNGRVPSTQDVLGTIRSITEVTHGRVADNVPLPPDAESRVVLYRTAWCGYCKQAASYMQQKGIPFIERDIEANSTANTEYRQLGGTGGVPLLVFGQKTMSGFSAYKFDQTYAEFQRTRAGGVGMDAAGMSPTGYGMRPLQAGDALVGKIAGVPLYSEPSKASPMLAKLNKAEDVVYMGEEREGLYKVTASVGEVWVDKLLVKKR
ncbi:hypothetical protein EGT07_00390 [Herbaspirillum sp. HC18]|nr:hypothetical protein EGT07_00390 [Herbaspirillum sp. HC18]